MNRLGLSAVLVTVFAVRILGQTPQEHEQHHPAKPPSTAASTGDQAANVSPPSMTPAMPAGGMMEMMGSTATPPLYPSLMAVPDMPAERRAEFERLAGERMVAGSALMSAAIERLAASTQRGDDAAMQEAAAQMREGQAQFESGLATRRALREGRAARDIALDWFRREMHLVPLTSDAPPHGFFGLSWFHYFTMFILSAFAVTMVGMNFRRMRRAEVLVARLAGGGDTAMRTVADAPMLQRSVVPSPMTELTAPAVAPSLQTPNVPPSKTNSWTGLLRVVRTFQETPAVKTFRLMDLQGGELPFRYLPGQFLTVTVAPNGAAVKRSYTIASAPTQREFCEITLKREDQGAVSRFLHDRVTEGDTLQVTAPSGKFTFTGVEATSVVLIAGGVGITPMMSAVRYLTARSWPGDIFLIYAVRDDAEVIFREELEYLRRRHANLRLTIVAEHLQSPGWPYVTGRITRELLGTVAELPARRVHLCGPPPMMDAVKALLLDLDVPASQIRTEVFVGNEQRQMSLSTLPAADTTVAVVTFANSHRTAMIPPTKTVLEAAEDVGVDIEYSCRIGTCGVCRTKLLSGTVTMEVEDGLEPGDKSNNVILACQARTTSDITVDA
ncbi:MAG: 2Fe-2S iron-sulfur cluster binding domain-containing protein [Cyanobacteria bacterium]|nr:2Fe-2S iron-sulfur cluster binding domain-containing protein [Cyanobacteriota bacterium]